MISRTRWTMLLLLLVAGLLYMPYLLRPINYDEAYTLRHYAFSPIYALLSYTLPNNHILNSFLVWLFTSLAGKSELAARFPAFAAGLLSLAMVYHVGRRFFGHMVGLVGAAFVLIHPAFILYSVSARGYSLGILLTLIMITLVSRKGRLTRGYRYSLIATCAGLILTLPSMAVLIASVGTWALFKKRSVVLPIIVGSIVGGMFYAAAFSKDTFHDLGGGYFGLSTPGALLYDFLKLMFPLGAPSTIFMGACAIIGIIWLVRTRHAMNLLWAAIFIIPVVAALVQLWVRGDLFFGRNYLYLLGPLALIAAYGLERVLRQWSYGAVLVLVVIGFMIAPSSIPLEDAFPLVESIKANLQPGESVVIGNDLNEPVWYYLGAEHPDWFTPDLKRGRVYFVETYFQSLSELLTEYDLHRSGLVCKPDTRWEPFPVSVCYLP